MPEGGKMKAIGHAFGLGFAALLTAGAVGAASQTQATAPAPVDTTQCAACHEPQVNGMGHTPHAGLERSCASCHGDVAAHLASVTETGEPGPVVSLKKMAPADVNKTCLECHDKRRQANWPGSVHDRRNVSCTTCHSVHAFKSARAQLKTERDSQTCFTCHQQMRAKSMRTSHHPVREGRMDCASCHDPHDGTRPKMIKADWTTELCLGCHTEKRGPFLWEHAPVRENCALCHEPHGSNHDKMLVAKMPFLCQRCHLNTRHPGTLYDAINTASGPSPSNRAVEHACRNCHFNIHGGNAPSGPYFGR
jgi:DmsE family decaheme c-type cytochrome